MAPKGGVLQAKLRGASGAMAGWLGVLADSQEKVEGNDGEIRGCFDVGQMRGAFMRHNILKYSYR